MGEAFSRRAWDATRSRSRACARRARSCSARPPPTISRITATARARSRDRCAIRTTASGVKTPGGSSAGSAVSVACGIAFAALGTDDGGSNRIPAQFCGIVGMKPTFGLVPRTGVIPTWPYLDTHGPLARHVADAALLLDAIAGPDASDGLALTTPWTRGALVRVARRRARRRSTRPRRRARAARADERRVAGGLRSCRRRPASRPARSSSRARRP